MASEARRPVNWSGLTCAAAAAPGLSLLAAFGMAAAATLAGDPQASAEHGRFILGGGLLLLAVVTVWGFVPAVLFGGLSLAVLRRSGWSSSALGSMLAGVAAAVMYVATGLALTFILPPMAFLLARGRHWCAKGGWRRWGGPCSRSSRRARRPD